MSDQLFTALASQQSNKNGPWISFSKLLDCHAYQI